MIRQLDIEWFAFAAAHPIHTTIYNPLAGGLLTGKHAQGQVPPAGSRFDGNKMYERRYWSDRMFELLRALGDVAKEEGVSLVDLAYAWVAGRRGRRLDPPRARRASSSSTPESTAARRTLSAVARTKVDDIYRAFQGTDATYAR